MPRTTPRDTSLNRQHITAASAIMLIAYPVLDLIFGASMILDPGGRQQLAPSLDVARAALPLWAWGAMWLALAALMVVAWCTGNRVNYVFALSVCRWSWFAWGGLIEVAVFTQPDVTYLAGILPCFVGVACWASLRSLNARER